MKSIVLVGCGASKASEPTRIRNLYTSTLFQKSLAYAESLGADIVRIASALYWLVDPADERPAEPYEVSLLDKDCHQRAAWGELLAKMIENLLDPERHRCPWSYGKPRLDLPARLVLLMGETYAAPIRAAARLRRWDVVEPLAGMQIGQRLQWLNQQRGELAA